MIPTQTGLIEAKLFAIDNGYMDNIMNSKTGYSVENHLLTDSGNIENHSSSILLLTILKIRELTEQWKNQCETTSRDRNTHVRSLCGKTG